MKKLLALLSVLFVLTAVSVSAEDYIFPTDGKYNGGEKIGALVFFNTDGQISSVEKAAFSVTEDGILCENIAASADNASVKLFLSDGKTVLSGENYLGSSDTSDEYNTALYKDDGAALFAPAMVCDVKQIYDDGDIAYKVTLLYQGSEKSYVFGKDILIASASDKLQDTVGNDVSCLKRGDAIILNHAFKDDIKSITLVYRPENSEPVFDSALTDFKPLYTTSSAVKNEVAVYSFGIVTEVGNNYVLLAEKDGAANHTDIISLHPDTSVYVFDMTEKDKPTITYGAGICPSYIDDSDIDQNGNISWRQTDSRAYALVRLYDDIATDILVYEY